MTVIQTMIIYIGCGSNMCNLIWLTCRPCGVPIENQRGQGGGLRLFWNRVIKTESHPLVKDSLSIYLLNIILTMIDFLLLRNLFQGDGVGGHISGFLIH